MTARFIGNFLADNDILKILIFALDFDTVSYVTIKKEGRDEYGAYHKSSYAEL